MSEYWVSKKKYYCKYCETFIADDAPSRQHHENGMRHKGNKERFVRSLYKQGERRKKDLEEEKKEMERIEKAAQAAYAHDIAGGRGGGSSSTLASPSSSSSTKKPVKPSNPYANYSTAQSLGYTDPDAEWMEAEEERRRTTGTVGVWEVVESEPAPTAIDSVGASTETGAVDNKRPLDTSSATEDTRAHKLRKKTAALGLGEIYDPGVIQIKIKKKEENTAPDVKAGEKNIKLEPPKEDSSGFKEATTSSGPAPIKWKAVAWGETVQPSATKAAEPSTATTEPELVDKEADETAASVKQETEETAVIKQEVSDPALVKPEEGEGVVPNGGKSLFRKRRRPGQ